MRDQKAKFSHACPRLERQFLLQIKLMACCFRCIIDPFTQVLVSVFLKPKVERVACRNLATSFGCVSLKIFDFTDIDADEAIPTLFAGFDLVLNPPPLTLLFSSQHHCPLSS